MSANIFSSTTERNINHSIENLREEVLMRPGEELTQRNDAGMNFLHEILDKFCINLEKHKRCPRNKCKYGRNDQCEKKTDWHNEMIKFILIKSNTDYRDYHFGATQKAIKKLIILLLIH